MGRDFLCKAGAYGFTEALRLSIANPKLKRAVLDASLLKTVAELRLPMRVWCRSTPEEAFQPISGLACFNSDI